MIDIKLLPPKDRIQFIFKKRIVYPRGEEILADIREGIQYNPGLPDPDGYILIAYSRAGKTTLLKVIMREFLPDLESPTVFRPGVYVPLLPRLTRTAFLMSILIGFGDPKPSEGNLPEKFLRIKGYIKDCKTRFIIFDDLHHLYGANFGAVSYDVTDYLKCLIKETGIYSIIAGTPKYTEAFINGNEQLSGLLPSAEYLDIFNWDEKKPESIKKYRTFLSVIEKDLPLLEESGISEDEDLSWRCWVATGGLIGFTTELLRKAARRALLTGSEKINLNHLKYTYQKDLSRKRGVPNPFREESPNYPPTIEALAKKLLDEAKKVNKRSKRRKERKETVSDVTRK